MKDSVRYMAIEVLQYVQNNGYLKDILEKKYKGIEDERNRRLLHEISYGVVRNQIYLNYVIEKFLQKKIQKEIRYILQIALYQLYFLDRIPAHAIVNEAVEISKKLYSKGSSSLVNGLLRNVIRNKNRAFEIKEVDPFRFLSIKYSFPMEWVRYFSQFFSRNELEDFLRSNNIAGPFTIRAVNCKRDELKIQLEKEGFNVKNGNLASESLLIEEPRNIFLTRAYKEGLFYVQDEGSQMVCENFTSKGDFLGLDLCAAPGGKTFQLLDICNLGVVAADVSNKRLEILRENARRLDLSNKNLTIMQNNATMRNVQWQEKFHRILVDAPCSGIGLIRRKPEIKNRQTLVDSKELAKIQLKILENAAQALQNNGELVYSTCTLTREENEEVVAKFLLRNTNFITMGTWKRYWPHLHGCDGFSMIGLKKRGLDEMG